ncbi:MAG: hypothetical protein Fur006_56540 [Coleofasciculaceae cyanobacterium]
MTQTYIVTECASDAAILSEVLPKRVLHNVKFIDGKSPYGAESMANTLLAAKRLPVVLVINAKTNDELMISERASELNYLLRQASPGIPFKVLIAVPELEVVFFQEREFLEELIGKKLTDLEWQFAQHHPKELLENLSKSSTTFIETTLNALDDQKLQVLRQHPLIGELNEFLATAALTPQ